MNDGSDFRDAFGVVSVEAAAVRQCVIVDYNQVVVGNAASAAAGMP